MERMDRRGQSPVWLFSSETLLGIPAAAEEAGSFNPEKYVPQALVDTTIFSLALYRWIAIIIGLALALGLGALLTRALVPLLRRMSGEELAWLVIKSSDIMAELYIMSLRRRGRPGRRSRTCSEE